MDRRRKIEVEFIFFEFIFILLLLLIPFYILIIYNFEILSFKVFQAKLVSFLFSFIKVNVIVEENYLIINDSIFEISWDSTGWKSMYILLALIFATPLKFRNKYKYILIAIPATIFINLLRLFITIYSTIILNIDFNFFHLFLWRYFMGIYVLAFWFLFIYNQKYNIGKELTILGRLYGRRKQP
ncbi:MAG: exosortase/archaeosortase family protein [Candidatus Aenigmatarchaeota archaeon]